MKVFNIPTLDQKKFNDEFSKYYFSVTRTPDSNFAKPSKSKALTLIIFDPSILEMENINEKMNKMFHITKMANNKQNVVPSQYDYRPSSNFQYEEISKVYIDDVLFAVDETDFDENNTPTLVEIEQMRREDDRVNYLCDVHEIEKKWKKLYGNIMMEKDKEKIYYDLDGIKKAREKDLVEYIHENHTEFRDYMINLYNPDSDEVDFERKN